MSDAWFSSGSDYTEAMGSESVASEYYQVNDLIIMDAKSDFDSDAVDTP